MSEPLTDQELIQLVQEKSPDELSEDEIERLRERLRESPALQEVLLEQLHLEAYLGDALNRFQVSIEEIVGTGGGPHDRRTSLWDWRFLLLFATGLGTLALLALLFAPEPQPLRPSDGESLQLANQNAENATLDAAKVDAAKVDSHGADLVAAAPAANEAATPEPNDEKPAVAEGALATPAIATPSQPGTAPVAVTVGQPAGTPQPVLGAAGWRVEVEAEKFARGNVKVDTNQFGKGIGVVVAGSVFPAFVEYEIDVPRDGRYQVDLRYAAGEATPLTLFLNGRTVNDAAAAQPTGKEWRPQAQKWFIDGVYDFQAGKNVVRLESTPERNRRRTKFPALDKLAVVSLERGTGDAPPPPQVAVETWEQFIQRVGLQLPKVPETSFALPSPQTGFPQAELERWLEPVAGQPVRYHATSRQNVPVSGFEGVLRFKSWPADGVWRLSAFDHHGLKLHVWTGREGVTLHYFRQPRQVWAAYATTRTTDQQVIPTTRSLVATDDGRYERMYSGPVELRYQEQSLILSRGGVKLLSVPLAAPPTDIFLEGQAWFREITMFRGDPLPPTPPNPRAVVLRSLKPAGLGWDRQLPAGCTVNKTTAGHVELAAEKSAQPGMLSLDIEEAGFYEVVLQVENAQPGTGVYLGDSDGRPLHRIGFFRDQRSGGTTFGFLRPDENRVEANYDPAAQPVPFVGTRQWLRLVLGHGSVKCWTSGDGLHWSRPFDPYRPVRGGFASVGLFCLPGEPRHAITLRHLEIRELSGITSLVPDELRDRALSLSGDMEIEQWLQAVLENEPEGADPIAWRQACALRTLSHGAWGQLGRVLFEGLATDTLQSTLPLDRRLRFLDEAGLVLDTWEQPDSPQLLRLYERLGEILVQEEHPRPYSVISHALLNTSLWTTAPVQTMPEALVRYELLRGAYEQRWDDVWKLCQQIRFWNFSSYPELQWVAGREGTKRLVDWSEAWAVRYLPNRRKTDVASLAVQYRHPLIEEVSKEGYNILAEFEAALSGKAFKDACQIVAAAGTDSAVGLLPDAQDRRLMVSLPRAVALAMREYPELQQTMSATFGPVGRLRVRQAVAEGDLAGVQAATVQFTGTDAAADAHAWLGDRALANGDFAQAIGQYQQALKNSAAPQRAQVQARMRLTHAMLGHEFGTPPAGPVEIGGTFLDPTAFERLIAELRENRSERAITPAAATAIAAQIGRRTEAPVPAAYKVGRRMAFDGQLGLNPGNVVFPGLDGIGGQFAAVVNKDLMLVSNRFEVIAYDMATGQQKWKQGIGGEQGDARSWPLELMRPAVAGDRTFVRRLTRQGPDLACLESATGKVLWTRRVGDHVASEPLIVQEELYVLSAQTDPLGIMRVALAALNPATGEILNERPLIEMRDVWGKQVPCEAIAVTDKIVAQIGGSVLCCDLLGQPRWLRRQTWIPPSVDAGEPVYRQLPLVAGNRVYVVQPGVLSVDCLDLESGRLHWQQVLPEVRRLTGIAGNHVIAQTRDGLLSLSLATGKREWQHPAANLLHAQVCGGAGGILYARSEEFNANIRRPALVWLNPETGVESGRAPLDELIDPAPMLGPVVNHGNSLWCAFGKGDRNPAREWVELVPSGVVPSAGSPLPPLSRWTTHVTRRTQDAIWTHLPGWTILAQQPENTTGFRPEHKGQREVLVTEATKVRPMTLARRVQLAPGSKAKLRLAAAVDPQSPSQVTIRANGQPLLRQTFDAATAEKWDPLTVDLSEFAGKTFWLTVTQSQPTQATGMAYWKQLSIEE